MSTGSLHGAPIWIELSTSNPDKSRDFYGNLFGWTSELAGEELGNYISFSHRGQDVAGGMQAMDGAPDTWLVYLHSDNTEQTVKEAEANGGHTLVASMPVADLGVMAVITDVGGAAVGIWQPGTMSGFSTLGEPGFPGWFELHTRDYDEAVAFYRDVFGWETHPVADSPEFRYTTLGEGEAQAAGIMDASTLLPDGVPAYWAIYFAVESTDASVAKAVELGGEVVHPAEDTPYGRLATVNDPVGATIKLMENNL